MLPRLVCRRHVRVSYLLIEEAKCQWLCEDHAPFYHDMLDNIKTATDLSHTAECECDDDALADVEALRAAGAQWYNHIEIPWFTLIAVRGLSNLHSTTRLTVLF